MAKQRVNFLPALSSKKREYLDAKQSLVALGTMIVLMFFYYSVTLWQGYTSKTQVYTLKREQAAVKNRMTQAKKTPGFAESVALEKEVAELQRRIATQYILFSEFSKQLAQRNATGFSAFLTGFSRAIIPNIWLTAIDIDHGGGALLLTGKTTSPALLPLFINRLQSEKIFARMTFSLANVTQEKNSKAVTFSITGEEVV